MTLDRKEAALGFTSSLLLRIPGGSPNTLASWMWVEIRGGVSLLGREGTSTILTNVVISTFFTVHPALIKATSRQVLLT